MTILPANGPPKEQSPFAPQSQSTAPTVRLWMLFASMMVFAGISLLLAITARIPSFANSLRDLFGSPNKLPSGGNDRSTHLLLLLVCYCSPMLMMFWVSMLRRFILFQQRRLDQRLRREQIEDSEFNMES